MDFPLLLRCKKIFSVACLFMTFLMISISISAQDKITVQGVVMDEGTNESLIGVSVVEKGTGSNGTITDLDGRYSLKVSPGATLVFSYVGYAPVEKVAVSDGSLNILLSTLSDELDEVVVIGYGTQKKESLIGSITTVEPAKLQTNQTRSLSNALVGQVSGIIGIQRSGEPGYDNSDFWIRGVSTFAGGKNPLVIVDGVERDMNNLSPEEIESFSVLKDAAATAVYGVRGANGAIVIKTKRGTVGKPRVTIKADYGISDAIKLPDYVDGAKHMEVINAARALSGATNFYSQEQIDRTRSGYDPDLYPNVNWIDQVTKNMATNGRITADVNGGSDRLRYRFIFGGFHETGIIDTDPNSTVDTELKLTKYNVRSNIDMDLTSSTLLTISIGGHITSRNSPATSGPDILDWAMQTPPIVHPAQYSTGEYPKNVNRGNPWAMAVRSGYTKAYQNSVQTVASVEQNIGKLWEPLQGLSAKVLFSFDAYNWHDLKRHGGPDYYIANGRDEDGNLNLILTEKGKEFLDYEKASGGNRNTYLEIPITYNRRFNDVHNVSGMLVYNQRDYINADAGDAIASIPARSQGLAGRFTYDFDNRYFGEVNFGYNGSETFQKGDRMGFFPSFALGWMISNEKFLQSQRWLDKLKLRGSWGIVGNDNLGGRRFGYLSETGTLRRHDRDVKYFWGINGKEYTALTEKYIGVSNLTWETSKKLNIGFELGLFQSLNLQFDYFHENRSDILMQRKILPELLGFIDAPFGNYGKVENSGVEISADYMKSFGKDLSISIMGNFTYASNKVIEYDEPVSILGTPRSQTGHNIDQNFGLIAERLYTDDDFIDIEKGTLKAGLPTPNFGSVKPGDIMYSDLDGDGIIDANDRTAIGNPKIPEIVYGFGFSMKYKKIDFGVMFQGMGNVDFIIGGNEMIPGSGDGSIGNILTNVDDRWTPENPRQDVFYPRLSQTKSENNSQASTWWLKSGSYLRLKHIELGYTLVSSKKKNLPFSNARLFLRGSNLFTISSFDLWDPELGGEGYKKYPANKIGTIGFEVTF